MGNKYEKFSKVKKGDKSPQYERPKKQKRQFKEVKFRPNIAENDFKTKLGQIKGFLSKKTQVRITLMLRGREAHYKKEQGLALLERVKEATKTLANSDGRVKQTGNNYSLSLQPFKGKNNH